MKELGCQQTMRRCSSICAVNPDNYLEASPRQVHVLVEYGNDPRSWVATVQHFLRVRLAPEDDPDGMQPTLRLAVLTLFERRTAPGPSGLHVASARRLVRDGAAHPIAVDNLQGMLVSAEPPAGEDDAGSIFFMEYFAFSNL